MAIARISATHLLQYCRQVCAATALFWASTAGASENVALDITTLYGKRHVFFEGDPIGFFVRTTQDAHVVVLYQSKDALLQIYPVVENSTPPKKLRAGLYHRLPPLDGGDLWLASEPFGCDRIWVYATGNPPPLLPGRSNRGFKQLHLQLEVIEKILNPGLARVVKTSLEVCTKPRLGTEWTPTRPHAPETVSHVHQ